MESILKERVKEMRFEGLIRFLERGGVYAVFAAEEGLRRYKIGDGKIGEEFFISVLRSRVEHGKAKEEAKRIKEIVAKTLEEKFFNDKSVDAIIDCEEIEIAKREEVAKKYLNLGGKESDILKGILDKSKLSQKIKNLAGEKLLTQKLKNDELLLIVQETTSETQMKALRIFLKKCKNLEDRIDLIENTPQVAEIVWEETLLMIRKKKPKERAEILYEIADYTDSENVKRDAIAEMWIIKEALDYDKLEYLRQNADLIKIENPEKVKKWIDENILKMRFGVEGYEKMEKIALRTKYSEIRERALKRAIKEAEKELKEKESSPYFRDEERIKFLMERLAQLKGEIKTKEYISEEMPALAQ